MRKAYFIFFLAVLIVGSAVFYGRVFSYDTNVAHPYLTEKAIELFNQNSEIEISKQEINWMRQGVIEEDTPIRYMNHFYNPTSGKGLWGFLSAKEWSFSEWQTIYPKGNQTWQKAIESYAKGDKKEAFIALGHILHLTEDMTVPAHTRDDAHPEGDSYEVWVKSNTNKELKIGDISKLNNIDEFFDFLAGYSNRYFLSKNSIDKNELIQKNIFKKEIGKEKFVQCLEGKDFSNNTFCLILVEESYFNKFYFIDDPIVHSDYYSLLAPKAISYGAGVIDLFFQEAEKERQKHLEKSWFEKLKEKIFSSPQAAGPGFVLNPQPVITSTSNPEPALTQTWFGSEAPTEFQAPQAGNEDGGHSVATMDNEPQSDEATPGVVAPKFVISLPYSGFGGGGGSTTFTTSGSATLMSGVDVGVGLADESEENDDDNNDDIEEGDNVEPLPVIDITPPDVSLSVAGCLNTNASSTCLLATPPSGGLNIFWSSSAEDLDYFEFTRNGEVSTTTATSITVVESDNNFSIRAKDTSGNWSEPQTTTVVVYSMPVVINEVAWMGTPAHDEDEWIELYNRTDYDINFDNNNWVLYSATDQTPYINLSGVIPGKGYFLIERKTQKKESSRIFDNDDNPMADLLTSFSYGLKNTGENLILSYASTTIDEIPYCNNWCGGVNNNENYRLTMERYDPDAAGADINNWGTNIGLIKNGKNVGGNPINGTPKARNSVNYLITKGQSYINYDIVLKKSNSPYVVAGMNNDSIMLAFQASSTLIIEPGVVIKFFGGAMNFYENAKIIAKGTADDPIVFTHFYDDEKPEWDIDGIISTSTPGSWYGMELKTKNQESVFDNVIFRYGGGYTDGTGSRANLHIAGASANIANSIFEYSKVYGLALVNSTSTVSNNIFRYNNTEGGSCGVDVNVSKLLIQSNQFIKNRKGLCIVNAPQSIIDSNVFTFNTNEAIFSAYAPPVLTNNSGSDNGIDGIVLYGYVSLENSTTTLKANGLPYILDGAVSVAANSALVVERGAEIKSGKMHVFGTLIIKKEDDNDLFFNSTTVYFTDGTNSATTTPPSIQG